MIPWIKGGWGLGLSKNGKEKKASGCQYSPFPAPYPCHQASLILMTSSNDCTLKQRAKRNLLVALLEYFYHCGEKNNTVISVFLK